MTMPRPRPHVLICIGGEEFSEDTFRFGARTAAALQADVSVLYVAPRQRHAFTPEVGVAQTKLAEWDIEHPGVRVLRYAREILAETGLAVPDTGEEPELRPTLRPSTGGAYELELAGSYGEQIRLKLREGRIVEQIVAELDTHQYSVVVCGAPKRRRLLHQIVQFANASVLIAKNVHRDYRDLLLPVDGSEAARRARHIAGIVARALHLRVDVLSVAASEQEREGAQELAEREAAVLARRGIEVKALSAVGDVVESVCEAAGDDHIVVLGASRQGQLWQYLFGSRPIRIVQRARSPVLVVKEVREFVV